MRPPNTQSDLKAGEVPDLAYRFRQASRIIAFLVATLGLVVFCGWVFNVPAVTYIRPTLQSMKVNTALSFLCLGAGLWLAHNDERQHSRRILGLLVVIIAGATLAEYAFHVSLGIDQLLFRDTRASSLSAYPGRMAIPTAICFVLLGLAVMSLGLKRVLVLQRALVGACFTFSLVALCGYLYGAKSLYSSTSSSTMSVHTVAGLMAACLAFFLAPPDQGIASIAVSDSHSGLLLRTLVPAIIVVPILIGWLRLAGQRDNLYDTRFGIALQVLGSIGCLSILTMLIARSMHRFERERRQIEEALKKSEEKFSRAFRGSPLVVALTRMRDHRYLDVSESFEKWIGWRREEVIGRTPFDIGIWVDPAERSEFVERLVTEGVVRNLEFRYRRKDGVEMVGLGSGELIEIGNEQCVISVIADITERKQAEEALWEMNCTLEAQGSLLRSREELLKVFVKNVPAAVAMLDRDMRYLQVSDRWCSDYLPSRAQILGRSHYEIFPDMPERWKEVHRRALQGETLRADEDRWDGQDGIHWARWEVRPWKTPEGSVGGILILAEDITRRKQMEETLSDLSRKLIDSQEQERARIARELHDDINQRLALLAIGLNQLREKHKDLPSDVRGHVQELQQMTSDISSSVYALSHELHSSTLDLLGLPKGMSSWCKAFGKRYKIKIGFHNGDVPKLPEEISLCLFRVLQEAVHNAAKHSGVKRVDVQLAENSGEIHLIVSDSGTGFDIEASSQNRGLGLTSMQERVRLVGGTIAIESKMTRGTTIHVRVPLASEHCSHLAAAV